MKIRRMIVLGAAVAMMGAAASAYAQRCAYCSGAAPGYDVATETTVSGTVDEVRTMTPAGGGRGMAMGMSGGGIHLTLSTASGPVDVHVGPASFVASKNVSFAKGDALTVVGASVTVENQSLVVAREIRKEGQVLTLRDQKGFPLWSGRGRR